MGRASPGPGPAELARQGFFWWEIDLTYYVLRALAAVGIIWDVREPPAHVVAATSRDR